MRSTTTILPRKTLSRQDGKRAGLCPADCAGVKGMLEGLRGSPPVKEVAHMVQFLLDAAAQAVAGVVVALFVCWLNRR